MKNRINFKKTYVFIDMDGVIVDFDGYMKETGTPLDDVKYVAGHYARMKPIAGAIEAVKAIINAGYEVMIATKPPTGNPSSYMEKAEWIFRHLPELSDRIIITHNKGVLGDERDFLIDDRPHKAHIDEFDGTLIVFKTEDPEMWEKALKQLGVN